MNTWWCEFALIDGEVAAGVTLESRAGRITSVAAGTSATADATTLRGLTLPGFANVHSHAFHRALRSRTQLGPGSFWTWREAMYRVADRLNPDNYHRLATAVFAEMAQAGMVTVGEFHYVHHGPDGRPYDNPNAMGEAVISAAEEVGIRITLLDTLYLHGAMSSSGHGDLEPSQRRFSDGDATAWADRVGRLRNSPHCRIGAAVHSVRAVDERSISDVIGWATTNGTPIHAHLSEQRDENTQCLGLHGCTPTELLESLGAFDAPFTAIHGTHLSASDISRIGAGGCTVCFCPTTERDLGDGIGPSSELVDAGASLVLGSDSHAMIDQMVEARALELDERLRTERRGIHAPKDLMAMATELGHRSLGWDDAGTIAVGRRADLVTITRDSPRMAGAGDDSLLEAAVFASTSADVTSVVVDGRAVVVDGAHRHLDTSTLLADSIGEVLG